FLQRVKHHRIKPMFLQ
ncbi:hypothetical protein CP03DC29_0379B, partial [Chlamydia psittaci 03DC29]